MTRLPPSASVAEPAGGAKLHAPAALRNADAICDLLVAHGPATGRALELASGTGQHVAVFARALPNLHWHPTDVEPARLASIDAHAAEAGVDNIAPARPLDACAAGWGRAEPPADLLVLVNLLHLIPEAAARRLLAEVAEALADGGLFLLYGPFKRSGRLTSDGDIRFDAELRAADPAIGYKDDRDLRAWLSGVGLAVASAIEMPANNLAFLIRKS